MSVNATNLGDEIRAALSFPTPVSPEIIAWAQGVLDELTIAGSASTGSPAGAISGMSGAGMAARIDDGYANITSPELLLYATALVNYMQSAIVVTYVDSPLYELNGVFSGMVGSAMAAAIAAQVPYPSVSAELLAKSNALVSHIHSNATANAGVVS